MKILLQHKTIVPKPMFLASPFFKLANGENAHTSLYSHLFLSEIANRRYCLNRPPNQI